MVSPMNASFYFGELYIQKDIDLLLLLTSILSPFALVLNWYGFYAIFRHSAAHLKVLQPHLLFHQVTLIIVDFTIFELGRPILILPVTAGFSPGLLKDWPPYLVLGTLCTGLTSWAMTCSTSLQIILFKHQILWPPGSRWTLSSNHRLFVCISGHLAAATSMFIPLFINGINYVETKVKMKQEFPFLAEFLDQPHVIAMDMESLSFTIFLIGFGFIIVFFAAILVIISISTFHGLKMQRGLISKKTFAMQKKYLLILYIQLLVPLGFSFIPATSIFIIIVTQVWIPVADNYILFAIAGVHGVVGTSLSLILNECYRKPVIGKFRYVLTALHIKIGKRVKVTDLPSTANVSRHHITIHGLH